MIKLGLVFGAALMFAPVSAEAAVTVTDYAFTNTFATGIYPTLSGTFSLSHDSISGVYGLTALNYVIDGFTHDVSNSSVWSFFDDEYDVVTIYGNINGRNNSRNTNDFDFRFAVGGGTDRISTVYSTTKSGVIPAGSVILNTVSAPTVPEPATWMMMITGFAGAGSVLRRRKTKLRFAL